MPELLARVPERFGTYHEPFLGGGALFWALWRSGRVRRAVLSDSNRELIDTYVAVRDHTEEVIALLRTYPYDRDFYYRLRALDPWRLSPVERAARMIYLNRTGYNGLYRLNRAGRFNVPFGRHRNPCVCDADNLRAVAQALRSADVLCADFATVLERVRPGDFVYMDPPYAPVSDTADFTAYTAEGFGWAEQERLREVVGRLTDLGVFVMISHSAVPSIRELYRGWVVEEVEVLRAVSCRADGRRGWRELILRNYGSVRI